MSHFSGDRRKVDKWWLAPNPMLGGIYPRRMVLLGNGEKLLLFVRHQLALNPEARSFDTGLCPP